MSVYGLSKLCGEYLVRSLCPRHFVVRTCGLYGVWGAGGKGGNFVETMLRLRGGGQAVARRGRPDVYADVHRRPGRGRRGPDGDGRYGLYHLTSSGSCSWYEFARAIFETAGVKADLAPITSREFGAAARRPAYSVLSGTAYERLGLPPMRPWREALAAYLDERRRKNRT